MKTSISTPSTLITLSKPDTRNKNPGNASTSSAAEAFWCQRGLHVENRRIDMDHETWIEENCECGIDKNGTWSAKVFDESGCDCRDKLPDYGYVWTKGELVEVEL